MSDLNDQFFDWVWEHQRGLCERFLHQMKIKQPKLHAPAPVLSTKILIAIPVCFRLDYGKWESKNSPHYDPANPPYGEDIHISHINDRVDAVRETWARDVAAHPEVTLKFFYGKPPSGFPREPLSDEVFLDCPDDYEHLPLKTVAIARWALQADYDYVLKTDDDTLCIIPRLIEEAATLAPDYGGHMYMNYCQGGCGYWLSRRALRALDTYGDNPDSWAEDIWVSRCMAKANILAVELPAHHIGSSHWFFGNIYDPKRLPADAAVLHAVQPEIMRQWYTASHPKIALTMICVNQPYWQYLDQAIEGAKKFFPADILLFTDSPKSYPVAKQVYLAPSEWPYPCLLRYHTLLTEQEWLSKYDYVWHMDVDLKIVRPILPADICADGITVQEHSGYIGTKGTPETDPRSLACCPNPRIYVHGCFQGGRTQAFLEMCQTLSHNIDVDLKNNFIPKYHDESHLVRYVYDNPPAKILPGVYVSPDHPAAHIHWIDKHVPLRPAENGIQIKKHMPEVKK